MPTLIIQDGAERRGGTFEWPLLIGSCPANAVMIADNSVAHVHAWIGTSSQGFFVANVNKNGRTFVNGIPVQGRRILSTGDVIQVGGSVKMTYFAEDALPKGVRPIAFPWRAPSASAPGEREALECGCGATIVMDPVAPKPANGVRVANAAPLIARAPEPKPAPAPVRRIDPAPVRVGAAVAQVAPAPTRTQPSVATTAPAPHIQPSIRPSATIARTAAPVARPAAPSPLPQVVAPTPAPRIQRPAAPISASAPATTVVVEPLELQEPSLEARLRATLPRSIEASEAKPEVKAPEPAIQVVVEAPSQSVAPIPEVIQMAPPGAATPRAEDPKVVVMNTDSVIMESITLSAPSAPPSAEVDVVIPDPSPTLSTAVAVVSEPEPLEEIATIAPIAKPDVETEVAMCAICQSRITTSEEMTECSECGLTFHADCWTENRGCAAYGCQQVGVLEPPDATPVKQLDESDFVDPFPWEFLLLGASVVSVVAGALAFGIPSALLGLLTIFGALRKGLRRWPLLLGCLVLAGTGIVVGLEFSKFWWLGWKPFDWGGQ